MKVDDVQFRFKKNIIIQLIPEPIPEALQN
jgi:hypothetical protein